MKYFIPILFLTASLLGSCSNDNKAKEQAERDQAKKLNDSIINSIYNHWNYKVSSLTNNTKEQTKDWAAWHNFISEIQQKPSKNISAYIIKLDKLTEASDELLNNIPQHLNLPQIGTRLNNLNTNIKYLNSFVSQPIISLEKVYSIQNYITKDINSINQQIDELVRIQNIPSEKGEQEMIQYVIDTTRRANFNFENQIKNDPVQPNLNRNNKE